MGKGEIHFNNADLLPEIIKLLNEGHSVTLSLKGFSMRPFLEDNRDKALLVKPTGVTIGNPVLAETYPGHFVLHRLMKVNITPDRSDVTLLGDGNLKEEHCQLKDVCGVVVGFYRKGRKTLDRVDGLRWKTYSWLWNRLFPFRRYLLAAYRRIWIPIFGPI